MIRLDNISKQNGHQIVFIEASMALQKGEKVGLVGPNGSGKTTLFRLIIGEDRPDEGQVAVDRGVTIGYFSQDVGEMAGRSAVAEVIAGAGAVAAVAAELHALEAAMADPARADEMDTISPGADFVEVAGARRHVIGYLESFLFPPERSRALVKSLSGGERNRLLLARLFARPANVLVLDEPTNDLDIETLELLEALLQDYEGTLFLVSHDRQFLDNVVTQSIAFEGAGRWKEYAGGYSDWKRASRAAPPSPEPQPAKEAAAREPAPAKSSRLTWKESRELEALPGTLEALEREQAELTRRLADPALYQDRTVDLKAMNAQLEQNDAELTRLLERWEALEAKRGK